MTIAIHLLPPEAALMNGFNDLWRVLADQHAERNFVFIISEGEQAIEKERENVTIVTVNSKMTNRLSMQYLYRMKMPRLFSKLNVTHFISPYAFVLQSKTVKQYAWTNAWTEKITAGKIFLNKNALQLTGVFTSAYLNPIFSLAIGADQKMKLHVLAEPMPLHVLAGLEKSQESVEENAAFVCFVSSADNKESVLRLIKAFSFFKKRMKSGIGLLLLLENDGLKKLFPDLAVYKYRSDVRVQSVAESMFNAHGLSSHVAYFQMVCSQIYPTLLGMRHGLPCVVNTESPLREIFNDNVQYAADTTETIAAQMIQLYKDDNERKMFSDRSINFCKKHEVERVAGEVWERLVGKE